MSSFLLLATYLLFLCRLICNFHGELNEIADLIAIRGENQFRVRSYRTAPNTIYGLTDAHSTVNLDNIKYGVAQARRGWLEKDDVINTRNWKIMNKLLKKS